MTNPSRSGSVTMDKAIARDLDREAGAGADATPPAARSDDPDPSERGRQANERQVRQGAAANASDARADEGGDEAPGLAQSSGKTGKAPKGGKDSGAGNERGGGPANSRKDAGSA